MAASLVKLSSFIAFLCFALLLSSPNENVEAALCERLSGRFIGNCVETLECQDMCTQHEGAITGRCKPRGFGFSCYCAYNCEK